MVADDGRGRITKRQSKLIFVLCTGCRPRFGSTYPWLETRGDNASVKLSYLEAKIEFTKLYTDQMYVVYSNIHEETRESTSRSKCLKLKLIAT